MENIHLANEKHDYGPSKRQAVYHFLARQFGLKTTAFLKSTGEIDESKCIVEAKPAMLVFGENGEKLPKRAIHGIETLKQILKQFN